MDLRGLKKSGAQAAAGDAESSEELEMPKKLSRRAQIDAHTAASHASMLCAHHLARLKLSFPRERFTTRNVSTSAI